MCVLLELAEHMSRILWLSVPVEKSGVSLMGLPLYVTLSFFLPAINILSSSCNLVF